MHIVSVPKIYGSGLTPVQIQKQSAFSYIFNTTTSSSLNPPAFIDADNGTIVSCDRIKHLALSLAWGLRHELPLPGISESQPMSRLSRGDTVMLLGPNSLSWTVALFASVAAGFRVTPASSAHTAKELLWQWTDSKARVVFVASSHVSVVHQMFSSLGVARKEAEQRIWVIDDLLTPTATEGVNSLANLIGKGSRVKEERFDGDDADETVYLCYSSGTTGRPKGVETTHRNIGALLEMFAAAPSFPEGSNAVLLNVLPLYHIFGLILNHVSIFIGATLIIGSKFDPETFCKVIEHYKVTGFPAAPLMLLALSKHPTVDRYNLRSLTTVLCGGAILPPALAHQFLGRLQTQSTTVSVVQGCASTELTGGALLVSREDSVRKFGSVGHLYPNLEARIMVYDDDDIEAWDAEEGQPGELWIRGPNVMKGYINNESETKSTITPDGWLKTGDIMTRDSDSVLLYNRSEERHDKVQMAPTELETILLEHPKVGDAAVIGVMDATGTNELPRAYIIPSNPTDLDSEPARMSLQKSDREWIESRVANYKFLRGGIMVVNSIPKGPAGKILRRVLVDQAKEELQKSAAVNLTAKL